jgi:hypothetical protein
MQNVILLMIAIIGVSIHLYLKREALTTARILEIILLWLLILFTGMTGVIAFLGHTFASEKIAAYIGWQAGSPFQLEVAVANLAMGVLGFSCIWLRGNFWIATVIAGTVWGFGTAFVHIREIIVHHNYAPGNAGIVFYLDFLIPTIFIALLIAFKVCERKETKRISRPENH